MRVTPKIIVEAGDMSADIVSTTVQLDQDFGYSIQAVWGGTPTGSFFLEASDDQVTWVEVFNSRVDIVAEDGKVMWNCWGTTTYAWARLSYTAGSGSGTLVARTFIRGF